MPLELNIERVSYKKISELKSTPLRIIDLRGEAFSNQVIVARKGYNIMTVIGLGKLQTEVKQISEEWGREM